MGPRSLFGPSAVELFRPKYTDANKQHPRGNGGVTNRYWWTQSIFHAELNVVLAEGTRAKDLKVVITGSSIELSVRGVVAMCGKLYAPVKRDASLLWNLEDEDDYVTFQLHASKVTESWWKSFMQGDPEIDETKVEHSVLISEYEPAARQEMLQVIEKEQLKQVGLQNLERARAELAAAQGLPPPDAGDDADMD